MRFEYMLAAGLLLFAGINKAPAHIGSGLVVDSKKNVYFADAVANKVWKVDEQGQLSVYIEGQHTHDLAMDSHDNLIGESTAYQPGNQSWQAALWRKNSEGKMVTVDGPGPEAFTAKYSVVMDEKGRRYQWIGNADKRDLSGIEIWSPDGKTKTFGGEWGHADGNLSTARFGNIGGMVMHKHYLYLADGNCIRRVVSNVMVETVSCGGLLDEPLLSITFGKTNHLRGIDVADDGTVYVANNASGDVIAITEKGEQSVAMTSDFAWYAVGVAYAHGKLYVLEHSFGGGVGELRVRHSGDNGQYVMLSHNE